MITLTETIEVPRSVASCFRYVADFRTTVEWDATAVEASKLTPGSIDEGSRFYVRCKAGRGHLNLAYEITELTPWQCLILPMFLSCTNNGMTISDFTSKLQAI